MARVLLRMGGMRVVMSAPVVSFTPEADVKDIVDAMIEHHLSAVPIVDPGSSRLIGIVSYVDVLRATRDALLF